MRKKQLSTTNTQNPFRAKKRKKRSRMCSRSNHIKISNMNQNKSLAKTNFPGLPQQVSTNVRMNPSKAAKIALK